MTKTTRRSLLAVAAIGGAAAATTVRAGDVAPNDAAVPVPSRAAAATRSFGADVQALYCAGYAAAGDRGEALYARAAAEPKHQGKIRTADGAWWELAPVTINPFMFGAKGDGSTDDSGAIQAMFDFVVAVGSPIPIQLLGARYYITKGLLLPTVQVFTAIEIDGGGAMLRTDKPITIFSRLPKDQDDAMKVIGNSHFAISDIVFRGTGQPGQIGLHIGASYTNVVHNCLFTMLDYGSIGTFCLASAWRDNRYQGCRTRAAVLQTGAGSDNGLVWPGASESESASNVSVFENCRVFGSPGQRSSFGIFGSDAVRINGCISEGQGTGCDVEFDFQGSPVCKHLHIDMFHCEAPNQQLNFRIRATGKVTIERIVRSYPAALLDMKRSVDCEVILRGIAWLGNMPEPGGKGPNPNGRWFYHSRGNGYGAKTEGSGSSGITYRFEEFVEDAWKLISDPARWESGVLPEVLNVRGPRAANNGMMEWSTAPISFLSPIGFADGSTLAGMKTGGLKSTTTSVPARNSVTEDFPVDGISSLQQFAFINPAPGQAIPPGIVWNGYVSADNRLSIRYTNVTDAPVSIQPGAQWVWCAPRRK
ncbi:hypothetical protein P1X14_14890 [Sphingomonas sp. AOB5]|uniref:hypothetical protein n=1 Tax=Sphingomonas sp. AOB5 TaxID=3034017 RepID=UPI0023F9AE6A|nr:hypothetical protein [Sphingomonas sp. AOB5]MDF7776540.1 hypothetical protein [Sphingomonas sp. AOB5]